MDWPCHQADPHHFNRACLCSVLLRAVYGDCGVHPDALERLANVGGSIEAFPYGYVMWLALLPAASILTFLDLPVVYGYLATLLIADFCLLITLRISMPERPKLLLAAYWCSPVVMLATYGMGLNDIIPALLLMASVHLLKINRIRWAGVVLAAALSSKISMIVAAPLILIYLLNNNALRSSIRPFMASVIMASTVFFLPFIASQDAAKMLFGNPELMKVLSIAIEIGARLQVYVVPLGYLLILYAAWRTNALTMIYSWPF